MHISPTFSMQYLLSQTRATRQHKAIAGGAGELCVGANRCPRHGKLASQRTIQLRVQCLLDLLIVAVIRECEYI